jgi:hypothetical protein
MIASSAYVRIYLHHPLHCQFVISVIYSYYLARNYPHYVFPVPFISLIFQSSATGSEPIPTSFLTGVSSLTLRSDGAQSHVRAVFLRKAFVLL